jgi:hypothetical protein
MKTCRRCTAPLPPREPGRRGPHQQVCADCRRGDNARARQRHRERARSGAAERGPYRPKEALGPEWPLLLPPKEAHRQQAALERRLREAVADGASRDVLEERFGAATRYLLERFGLRVKSFGGCPLGPPV